MVPYVIFAIPREGGRSKTTGRGFQRKAGGGGKGKVGIGRRCESLAADWLASEHGYAIVRRNAYFGRFGEVDIIARDEGTVCFVEVRARSSALYGTPGESVGWEKARRIRTMAEAYLMGCDGGANVRFDVVEVYMRGGGASLNLIKGAF